MSKLYFKVASDWQEVVRLRDEISKLESQIKSMDANKAPQAVAVLNHQMQQTKQQMQGMITEAAKAGAVMDNDFKSKIYQSSQSVNDFTQKIINQKAIIKDVEADVRKLGESYRSALKNNPLSASGKLAEYTSAKKALDEEKSALFGLTQEQANARLSVKKLRDEYALYKEDGKDVSSTTNGIGVSLKKTLAIIGGAAAIKQLGSNIIRVRGEFQAADTAIQTLLGSKEKADNLMAKVKEYAKISPLEFSDVTQATQMMLGFNIEAERVPQYLRAIGDISMGETGKFNSLTLAFSQMSATGKLMGQDLNQMINAGFNPLQQIADTTGKSIAILKDEMSKGAISAEMVQQAFMDATSAGGKFFGMSENASKTINGQLSMMQDALDEVFNELGAKGEGVIMAGIQASTSLIHNYEMVGKVLSGLVVTYGAYRTAVMLSTIATGKHTIAEVALTNVRVVARRAQMALNASMLANPYVLLATVVIGAAAAMWALHDGTTAAEKAQTKFNKEKEEAIKRESDHKAHIDSLISTIQDESAAEMNRIGALEQLKNAYPHIFAKYIDEKGHLRDIIGYKKEIAEFDAKVSVGVAERQAERAKQELIRVNKEINYRQESTTGASKFFRNKTTSELREMQSGLLQSYQLKQSEYDKLAELDAKMKAKLEYATVTQDKSYWEKQKKDAQTKLDSLTDIEASGKKGADLKQRITEYDKKIGSFSVNASKQEESASEKLRKQNEKLKELSSKQSIEQSRAEEDLQNQLAQSKINAMANGFDKVQAQRELDNKKELQAIERQKEDYIRAYIQAQKELFNAEEDLKAQKDKNYKKRTFDSSSVSVNTSGFDTIISNTKNKQSNDSIAQQESDWNEYIIKYGTFLQKKQAITEKYNKLINEADTSGKAALLQKEMEEALSSLSVDKLKQEINWEVVFGDMSKVAKKQLQQVKRQLTEFKKSPEFKNSTPEQVKVIEEALDKINSALVDKSGFFGGLGDSLADYKLKLEEAKKAQEEYDKALKTGNQALIEKATESRNTANANATNAGTNLEKSGDKAVKNINAVSSAIIQLGKKDVSLTDIGSAVGALVDTLGKSGSMIGGIISAILSIVDAAGDIGTFQYGMNLVENVSSKVTDAFARDTEAITGLDMSFMKSADYDDYNELVEQYDVLVDVWDQLLDKKKAYIKESYGVEATKVGQEALDLLNAEKKMTKELASSRLDAGASAGSHSISYRMWEGSYGYDGTNWKDVAGDISKSLGGVDFSSMRSMLNMSAEQLEKIKTDYSGLWAHMDGDFKGYLDDIIKYGDTEKEIIKSINEQLTQVSFSSVFDGFVDVLMDMDSSAEDFANNFEKYMQKAILTTMVSDKYKDKLQIWYDNFAKSNDDKAGITKDELDKSQKEWDTIVSDAVAERDKLKDLFGWTSDSSSSQDSTNGGFETMSQDEGKELNGRFTAFQISNEEIRNQSILQSQSLSLLTFKADALLTVNTEVRNIADETRTILANSYLELVQISENTSESAKYLKDIKSDISDVKRNTSRI